MNFFLLIALLLFSSLLTANPTENHQQGKYASFLKKIDKSKSLIDHTPLIPPLCEQCKRELIEICIEHPNHPLSCQIKKMVFFTPSPKEQKSLDFVENLYQKLPSKEKPALEKFLVALSSELPDKTHLELAHQIESYLSTNNYLTALGEKRIAPKDSLEEKVQTIMIKYAKSRSPEKS